MSEVEVIGQSDIDKSESEDKSDAEDESDGQDVGVDAEIECAAVTKKRNSLLWMQAATFDDNIGLEAFLRNESWWQKNKVTRTSDGTKQYFYCKSIKHGRRECGAKMYVVQTDNNIILFRSGEHSHEMREAAPRAANDLLYNRVKKLIEKKSKFRAISHILRTDETVDPKPSDNQVILLYLSIPILSRCIFSVFVASAYHQHQQFYIFLTN